MSLLPNDGRMKPILIIPPGEMSAEDIKRLNDNGICTVEAKSPSAVKFLDPIPSTADRSNVEQAAIMLSRKILNRGWWNTTHTTRQELATSYLDLLFKGTPLDSDPSQAEQERKIFDEAKRDELRRLAREEAAAERKAEKERRHRDEESRRQAEDARKAETAAAKTKAKEQRDKEKNVTEAYRLNAAEYISVHGPTTQSELCRKCSIPTGSMTNVFDHKWFEHETDGVHLTNEGLTVIKGAKGSKP